MGLRFSFIGILALTIGFSQPAAAEKTIYDIVSDEDTAAFSDMYIRGYDVDEQDLDGMTPLMLAAARGKATFVSFLLANGANINKKNYNGQNSLHMAAANGHNEVINILIDGGINVNMPDLDGMTPLMLAVKNEQRFSVEILLKRGAILNYFNARNQNAMKLAEMTRNSDIINLLKTHK